MSRCSIWDDRFLSESSLMCLSGRNGSADFLLFSSPCLYLNLHKICRIKALWAIFRRFGP